MSGDKDATMPEGGFPPRVWVVNSSTIGYRFISQRGKWRSVYGDPLHYLSLAEHDSLLTAAREQATQEERKRWYEANDHYMGRIASLLKELELVKQSRAAKEGEPLPHHAKNWTRLAGAKEEE